MATGIVWDERYLLHDMGRFHPERPARLTAIRDRLQEAGLLEKVLRLEPRMASLDEIGLIHAPDYVRELASYQGQTVPLDPDTTSCPQSYETACLATGGLLNCVDEVMKGRLDNAFAFVRPPGHHAEKDHAMGFCIFNNVAIAAEYARHRHGLEKIFIMDYDVHHGNGTQWAFYGRSDVFYCSTHQYPFYPGTGAESEDGTGQGCGYTLNIPMKAGQGDIEYATAFANKVMPALSDYRPDLILLSAGYDAHTRDHLAGMNVSAAGFAAMTKDLLDAAQNCCEGRLVAVLEGGYDLQGLAESVEASLREMLK